jgi:cbb3-type cytochrome oxidase cytochrome c subunit
MTGHRDELSPTHPTLALGHPDREQEPLRVWMKCKRCGRLAYRDETCKKCKEQIARAKAACAAEAERMNTPIAGEDVQAQ